MTLLLDLEGARLADVRQPLDLATRCGQLLGDMFDHIVLLLLLTISLLGLSACNPVAAPGAAAPSTAAATTTIIVFAPSSLADAVTQLGADYEATQPGTKVQFEIGHTPTQRTQIEQGASPDVILAAGRADVEALAQQGFIAADTIKPLARNQLIVILAPDNPAAIAEPEDLAKPGIRLLTAAPDLPIGVATQKLLDNLSAAIAPDFKDKVPANVVSTELGVKRIVTKVGLGEADAGGIVYLTDATAAPELATLPLPDDTNVTVTFFVAPLAASSAPEAAAAFVAYVRSDAGQATLCSLGFLPPAP